MNDFTDDLQQARDRVRTETINGVKYTIQCTDPYGLWHINTPKGGLASHLEGSYTSAEKAFSMIKAYESSRMVEVVKIKPVLKP